MNERRTPDDARIDAGLKAALRSLYPEESPDFTPPDEADVRAYVQGRADETQSAAVEEAMLLSAGFQETIGALRQAELDFADGEVLAAAAEVAPPADVRTLRRPTPVGPTLVERFREWFWTPQLGFGLAAACLLALLLVHGLEGERSLDTRGFGVQRVAMLPVGDSRSGIDVDRSVLLMADTEYVEVVIAKELPQNFTDVYQVKVELKRDGDPEPIFVDENHTTVVTAGEGSVFLMLRISATDLATGGYSAVFTPIDGDGELVESDEILRVDFRVVDLRA